MRHAESRGGKPRDYGLFPGSIGVLAGRYTPKYIYVMFVPVGAIQVSGE
jgi:hypothetical protein